MLLMKMRSLAGFRWKAALADKLILLDYLN